MSGNIALWWQSLVSVGAPVFPYVGLVLLIVLAVLALGVLLYWLYRLSKRLPPALRYCAWWTAAQVKKMPAFVPGRRRMHLTAANAGDIRVFAFAASFGAGPFRPGGRRLPALPLFAVAGLAGSGKSSLLRMAAGYGDGTVVETNADAVWWRLEERLALELHPRLLAVDGQARRAEMLYWLERFCPARPLDGVIVVVSASSLLNGGDRPSEELRQLAHAVGDLCAAAGQALPLYVVVSGADRLAGFDECVRVARGRMKETGLHWLCADAGLDADAALTAWSQNVQACLLRSLVAAPPADSAAALSRALALPSQIECLRQALSTWLRMPPAASGGDGGRAQLRGVLLSGLAASAAGTGGREPWGLGELASGLAFAQPMPVRPSARYARRSQRQTMAAAAALAGSLALFAFWIPRTLSAVRADVTALHEALQQNAADIERAGNGGVHAVADDPRRLERLLGAVAASQRASLRILLAPGSWFDDTRERLQGALGGAVQSLLVAPRLAALAGDRPALSPDDTAPVRAVNAGRVEELPAYAVLRSFLDSRELAGAARETAESLPDGVSYHDLVRFLGNDPGLFFSPAWEWRAPLPIEVVRRFDTHSLRPDTAVALGPLVDALWERVLQEAFDLHPAAVAAEEVNALALRLGRDPNWSYEDAAVLRERLQWLLHEVERPQAQRLLGKAPDALRFVGPALARLSTSAIVPVQQRAEAGGGFNARRDAVRRRLLSYEPEGIGRLFVHDAADDRLVLSPEVKRFAASYAALMGQPFMQPPTADTSGYEAAGQPLSWEPARIAAAKALSAALREYAGAGIQAFDPGLRPNLMRLARLQFRRTVDTLYLHAARPLARLERAERDTGTSDALMAFRARAENLSGAARLYKQALSQAEESTQGEVGELLAEQMLHLLGRMQALLLHEDPYASLAGDARRWVASSLGGHALAAVLRGNPKERLLLARDYVRTQYAAAAVSLLGGLGGLSASAEQDRSVQWWRRLTDALEAFDKGAAANGLHEFEQYILNLSRWSDPDDCARHLAERAPVSWRSDYFSNRLAQLDEMVAEACVQRIADSRRRKYAHFSQWFNAQIAGHPPFSGERRLPPLSRRAFAAVLERYRDLRKQLPVVPPGWPEPVARFLAQMEHLSVRFSAPEQGRTNASGVVPVPVAGVVQARLQFRSNRAESVMAEQIIDWSILSGARHYGLRNTGDLFEWRIGEPIEVRLRWAAHSPYSPVAAGTGGESHAVEERAALFRFAGDWSLLELVRRHGVRGDGVEQVVLRFDVNVAGPEGRAVAQAFITLASVDDQSPLALDFPESAPAFPLQPEAHALPLKLDFRLK